MNWISVKDRLPEVGQIVQTFRNRCIKGKIVKVGETKLWHFEGETRYTYEEPSHWMPLPEPPKK